MERLGTMWRHPDRGRTVLWMGLGALTGAVAGWLLSDGRIAVFGAFAGSLFGWAKVKGALFGALRGGVIGAVFLALAGPVIDRFISGRPLCETLSTAAVVGVFVGAALGIRNTRRRRSHPTQRTDDPSSSPSLKR
jgi:hypothetical protein